MWYCLAALVLGCGNRLPVPQAQPDAAETQGAEPVDTTSADSEGATEVLSDAHSEILDTGPEAHEIGNDLPPSDMSELEDLGAETDPGALPTDVSLVTDCKPKPLAGILAEAKAKGVVGYVYVLGGWVPGAEDADSDGTLSATVQRLDLTTGTWSTAGVIPELRFGGIATWVRDSVWLMGGISCAPGYNYAPCPGKYPSICGKSGCFEMWRRGPGGSWASFGLGIAGEQGFASMLPAGCSVLYAWGGSVYTFDGETGKVVKEVNPGTSTGTNAIAMAAWQDGFAVLGGVSEWSPGPQPILLLDAAGNPTGKTLPAPPCAVESPRMWSTATHLFVLDTVVVDKASNCSGLLEESKPDAIEHVRPVVWDGSAWSVAPTVPGALGRKFVQTPIGVVHIGSASANGKVLKQPQYGTGTVWMDPVTHMWSDAKYPPMPIAKAGVAATWAPK